MGRSGVGISNTAPPAAMSQQTRNSVERQRGPGAMLSVSPRAAARTNRTATPPNVTKRKTSVAGSGHLPHGILSVTYASPSTARHMSSARARSHLDEVSVTDPGATTVPTELGPAVV